jgi:hypothetical protein
MKNRLLVGCLVLVSCLAAYAQDTGMEPGGPKAVALEFGKAMEMGDAAAAKKVAIFGKDEEALIDGMAAITGGMKKMLAAATEKFGAEGAQSLMGPNADMNIVKQIEESELKIDGDTATLAGKDSSDPLKLKKVDGAWKVDVTSMNNDPNMAQQVPMFNSMAKVFTDTAAEISAGKYSTVDECQQAMQAKFLAAMMSAQPPAAGEDKPADQPAAPSQP